MIIIINNNNNNNTNNNNNHHHHHHQHHHLPWHLQSLPAPTHSWSNCTNKPSGGVELPSMTLTVVKPPALMWMILESKESRSSAWLNKLPSTSFSFEFESKVESADYIFWTKPQHKHPHFGFSEEVNSCDEPHQMWPRCHQRVPSGRLDSVQGPWKWSPTISMGGIERKILEAINA